MTPVVAEVRQALNTHHVIFFRDQDLSPGQQADFARQFGEVTEGHPVIPAIEENPEVLAIDGSEDRASWWHTDVTFLQAPAFGSILYMLECPEVGGDTTWASLQDAYDRLAEPVRDHVRHPDRHPLRPLVRGRRRRPGRLRVGGRHHEKLLPALHPVVRTHPENGRNGLFVNPQFTQSILGLSKNESNAILDMLYRHCQQPELTCRFRWQPGLGGLLGQPGHPALRPRRLRRRHPHRPPGHPAGRRPLRSGHAPALSSPTARAAGATTVRGRPARRGPPWPAAPAPRYLRPPDPERRSGTAPDTASASSLAPR